MSVLRSDVSVRLRIVNDEGDEIYLPVANLTMSFAVSELPSCNVELPLGKAMRPGGTQAVTSEVRQLLANNQMVKLYARISGDYSSTAKWNDKDKFVIFEGRIKHISDSITRLSGSLSLTINHWAHDMTDGSILLDYIHPSRHNRTNMLAASYGANLFAADGVVGRRIAGIGQFADSANLTLKSLEQDLWSLGVKQLIGSILTNPLKGAVIDRDCLSPNAVNVVKPKVREAWQRIEGKSVTLGSEPSKWAVPLRLGTADSVFPRNIVDGIADQIVNDNVQGYATTDPWTKAFKHLGAEFRFVFIPRISSAIVAPYLPSLQTPFCHRIVADDIAQIDCAFPVRSDLRAVGVYGTAESGYFSQPLPGSELSGVQCYSPDPVPESGKIRFIDTPSWMKKIRPTGGSIKGDYRTRGTRGGVGSTGKPYDPSEADKARTLRLSSQDILQRYAKMQYAAEKLHGRSAKVVGKLRFDIAPGSTVETLANLRQIRGAINDSPSLQGYVSRVTISIDANRRLAMTMFQLDHVRTLEENYTNGFTMDEHPLYAYPYHGATLSDDFENELCPE